MKQPLERDGSFPPELTQPPPDLVGGSIVFQEQIVSPNLEGFLIGRILNSDTYLKREIARDKAATFSLQDYLSLAESDYLFARKFTEQ